MKYPNDRDRERGARQALLLAREIENAGGLVTVESIHGLAWELAKAQRPARAWNRHSEALASGPDYRQGMTGDAWRFACLEHEVRHQKALDRLAPVLEDVAQQTGTTLHLGLHAGLTTGPGASIIWLAP